MPDSCCAPSRGEGPESPRPAVAPGGGAHPGSMVTVPAGRYRVGDESEWSYPADGEAPVHDAELAVFRIDRHAVTNRQFAAFVAATGWRTEAERFEWSFVFGGVLARQVPPDPGVEGAPWWG